MMMEYTEIDQKIVGYSNNILVLKNGKENTYFLPSYLRLKIKNLNSMDIGDLIGTANCTIIFSVYYGNLSQQIVKQIIPNISLLFNLNQPIHLRQSIQIRLKDDKKQKIFTYTLRKVLTLKLHCQVFWSPFQVINLLLTITVQTINLQIGQEKVNIKFNLMSTQNNFLKISYTQQGTFGNYDLAQSRLSAYFSNIRQPLQLRQFKKQRNVHSIKHQKIYDENNVTIQRQDQQIVPISLPPKRIKHYQYSHFTIPLYKYPAPALITIFIPLWLLGIINLGIFFQDQILGKRFINIAALMVSYVALIPTIRQQVPPSPRITFIQLLVYLQAITSLLSLAQSLFVRNIPKFSMGDNWKQDGLFIASLAITIFNIVCVIILFFLHKLVWQPSYNRVLDQQNDQKFEFKNWKNYECDKYFYGIKSIKQFEEQRQFIETLQ